MLTERIPLPEHPDKPGVEQWAEIRAVSTLRAGDRKAVRGAVKLTVGEDGEIERTFTHANVYLRKEALLRRVIVAWSLPVPHPQENPGVFDDLPMNIYDALADATEEHLAAVDFTPRPTPTSGPPDSDDSATTSEDTESPDTSPTPS